MTQRLWEFSYLKQFPVAEEDSHSSAKLTQVRTLLLIFWLALVYSENLDLRLGKVFENISEAESVSFSILLLV